MQLHRLLARLAAFVLSLTIAFVQLTGTARAQATTEPRIEARVVVGIFGGLLGRQLRDLIDSYVRPLGVQAVYVEGTSNDLLARARAQAGNPQMDLFVGNDQTFQLAKSLRLIERIDPRLVPEIANIRPELRDPDGYGQFYELNPIGIVYRTDRLAEAGIGRPTTWLVYTEPSLRGRGILFPPTVSYGFHFLIGLAMSAGKDERDLTPAWPLLDRVRANQPLLTATPGQAEDMAGRGEGWMYVSSAQRAHLLRSQGAPIDFALPREGVIALPNFMAPVRNARNPVAAQRVLNHMLGREVQTRLTREGAVASVNTQVELTPELKARMGFDPQQPLPAFHVLDVAAVNQQLDAWLERFNRTVAR